MPEKEPVVELKTITIEGKTYAEVQDGKPVFVIDGREVAFDAPGTVTKIGQLNGEAKAHRERAEKAEGSLKAFEGISDPAAAKKALETLKNLDDKRLVDAGEVEKVKAEAIKAVEEKYAPIVEQAKRLEGELYGEKIGGSFARSKFIAEKIAVPADIVQSRFGQNFRIEDGKITAYDQSGNKLYSKANPGNPADFEEALELLIDAYPYKEHILKGTGGTGGGARGSTGTGGSKTITRAEFSKLSPDEQVKTATGGQVQIVD
jgi:hypothetical protein